MVTTDVIQRLSQHNVELSGFCILKECLNAGRRIMLAPEMPVSL